MGQIGVKTWIYQGRVVACSPVKPDSASDGLAKELIRKRWVCVSAKES